MRSLSHLFLGLSIAGLFLLGCERHQFDDTKILHGDHGSHGGGHAADDPHGEAHGEDKAHHEEKSNGEKPKEKKKEEPRDVGL